jgi:hypothetical protein
MQHAYEKKGNTSKIPAGNPHGKRSFGSPTWRKNVNLSLFLTKYHSMQMYEGVEV